MKFDVEALKDEVRLFIVENFLYGTIGDFTDKTDLLSEGIIDSTGILEIISFLEDTWDIDVADDQMTPELLGCVTDIVTCFLIPELRAKASNPKYISATEVKAYG